MSTTPSAHPINAEAIGELVRPLGIELPPQILNYAEHRPPEETSAAFETEIERILEIDERGSGEGVIESEDVALRISGSKETWDKSDEWVDYIIGPSRHLSLTVPFRIDGLEENWSQTIAFGTSRQRRTGDEPSANPSASIYSKLTIPTTPLLEAFQLGADSTDYPYPSEGEVQSILTAWHYRNNELKWGVSNNRGVSFNRAFGIGVEVLKQIEPDMLQ